jgi:hypothetical protein
VPVPSVLPIWAVRKVSRRGIDVVFAHRPDSVRRGLPLVGDEADARRKYLAVATWRPRHHFRPLLRYKQARLLPFAVGVHPIRHRNDRPLCPLQRGKLLFIQN